MTERLITERLILRPYDPQDAGAIAALIGDLEVSRWLTWVPHPYALGFVARDVETVQSRALDAAVEVQKMALSRNAWEAAA